MDRRGGAFRIGSRRGSRWGPGVCVALVKIWGGDVKGEGGLSYVSVGEGQRIEAEGGRAEGRMGGRAEGLVDAWAWACFWKRESLHEVWKVRVGPRLVY